MFSKIVVDSDEFLEMPATARLLYYDLGVRADDDGFVQPKRLMAMTGSSTDDLKVLLTKGFAIAFEDKVLVITDWLINNQIRSDRYKPSTFTEFRAKLFVKENGQYSLGKEDGIPLGNHLATTGCRSIGKDSLVKNRLDQGGVGGNKSAQLMLEGIKLFQNERSS
jgi:hypothetical protein